MTIDIEKQYNWPDLPNKPAPGAPYYTPIQEIPAGAAKDPEHAPALFKPIQIRGLKLQNRIFLSPLCQYSADDGHVTDWQLTHIGGIVQRGPGLTCVESSAVMARGRSTPQHSGIYKDSHVEPWKRVVDFAHSQGQHIIIQMGHAGWKSSTVAPWLDRANIAIEKNGGWPTQIQGPSAIAYAKHFPVPNEMTLEDIEEFKAAYAAAAKRAMKAGFDGIELHAAHGYLMHSFYSPVSNKRTDKYGGSFENRTRLILEVAEIVRRELPEDKVLFARITGTDWLDYEGSPEPESWTLNDAIKLGHLLADRGVDLLDVSSGGISPHQRISRDEDYQADLSLAIKKSVGDKIKVTAVGRITSGKQANRYIEAGLDAVFVGRLFQKNPGLVWQFAEELNTPIKLANQIEWGFARRDNNGTTSDKA
ncbi:FMN-linked oxidoreductase [Rhizodiscina lignyota]|uniref:FMN-linked oxidoreductase n=1 Tax=Rhizodiscina lignyota TaxID=1504668 RepID=A0A9P4I7M8_9PEZI|nr:FMN-linked oxidoreductase [Rhizodiscina lignyota]